MIYPKEAKSIGAAILSKTRLNSVIGPPRRDWVKGQRRRYAKQQVIRQSVSLLNYVSLFRVGVGIPGTHYIRVVAMPVDVHHRCFALFAENA